MAFPPVDPAEERVVAERLLPVARQVVVVPGVDARAELLALVERLSPPARTEILAPPDLGTEAIEGLLGRGFTVYDAAAAPRAGALILDRRLGWRLPAWEPLPEAFKTACRLLWTRLGYYTVQTGTVEAVHPENRLFSFRGRSIWVNAAYRDLALPGQGDTVRVVGMFSFLGSTLPILHALAVEPAAGSPPPGC